LTLLDQVDRGSAFCCWRQFHLTRTTHHTGACGCLSALNGACQAETSSSVSKVAAVDHAVDAKVFSEILNLDDDEDQNFSRLLIIDFVELTKHTLDEMDACEDHYAASSDKWPTLSDRRSCREQKDFKQLGDKAGFLRGPCTTLGISKVGAICARIEQLTTESMSATLCDTAGLADRPLLMYIQLNLSRHQSRAPAQLWGNSA
jgi:hypothetical protein